MGSFRHCGSLNEESYELVSRKSSLVTRLSLVLAIASMGKKERGSVMNIVNVSNQNVGQRLKAMMKGLNNNQRKERDYHTLRGWGGK